MKIEDVNHSQGMAVLFLQLFEMVITNPHIMTRHSSFARIQTEPKLT